MGSVPFDSFAQNAEDVVLWRALGHVIDGSYVDIGASHPSATSITRAFDDRGWRGLKVAIAKSAADEWRRERSGDTVVEAVLTLRGATDLPTQARTFDELFDTVAWSGKEIHFMSLDGTGSETEILRGLNLDRWRPWALVVRSSAPPAQPDLTPQWEELVEHAGYRFCLTNGASRFFVALEHDAEIGASLSVPANSSDNFTTLTQRDMAAALDEAIQSRDDALRESVRWQSVAIERWSDLMEAGAFAGQQLTDERRTLDEEYRAIHDSLTWRVARYLQRIRLRLTGKRASA
jgi:hypothetical protein